MTHRVVAFGDTHLRSTDPWNADRLAAWDQVITEGLAIDRLAAWVHAGDVFDTKSTVQDRNDVAERLQRMAAVAPVLVVEGNHEAPGDLAIFRKLRSRWPIVVVETAEVVELPLATGATAAVFAVAYPRRARLVSLGTEPGQVATEADRALDVLCMDAAAKLQLARSRGQLTLMVGHGNIIGAVTFVGQPAVGLEISFSAAHLARLGPILKLFGHIHLPQEVSGAVYLGSGCRLSYGETEAKRYVVATFTTPDVPTVESKPLTCPPRFHVEGVLSRDGFDWRVTKGPDGPQDDPPTRTCAQCGGSGLAPDQRSAPQSSLFVNDREVPGTVTGVVLCDRCRGGLAVDWTGCDVRVRMRYPSAERDVLEAARARVVELFAGARRVDLEPVAVSTREVRAPEVVAATTLPEKLAAWARLSGVTWAGEIERCAQLLVELEDADALAADVAARLEPLADLAADVNRLTVEERHERVEV